MDNCMPSPAVCKGLGMFHANLFYAKREKISPNVFLYSGIGYGIMKSMIGDCKNLLTHI